MTPSTRVIDMLGFAKSSLHVALSGLGLIDFDGGANVRCIRTNVRVRELWQRYHTAVSGF
jgi:hypothetical protein